MVSLISNFDLMFSEMYLTQEKKKISFKKLVEYFQKCLDLSTSLWSWPPSSGSSPAARRNRCVLRLSVCIGVDADDVGPHWLQEGEAGFRPNSVECPHAYHAHLPCLAPHRMRG